MTTASPIPAAPFAAAPRPHRVRRALAVFAACLPPLAALAGTTIERGDVLRVEVMNAPEFSRDRAPVDADGRIALLALGTIQVAGRDTDTARAEIAAAFAERGVLVAPVVLVEVTNYRQVYVGGRVGRPGAIDFVPGMTARQAIVTAGGIRLVASETATDPAETLSAIAERASTAFALAQVVARISRLQAQLDGAENLTAAPPPAQVPPGMLDQTAASETALLSDIGHRTEGQRHHARDLLTLIDVELDTLSRQMALQDTEAEVQAAEIEDARSLVERGLMPRPRLQELLREQSRLNRDRLETSAFTARARQEAETVRFELQDETARRREDLRLLLQEARRDQARLEADIESLDLRIMAGGLAPADPARTRLVIHRTLDGVLTGHDATMDDPVLPGDVLELILVSPGVPNAPDAAPDALPAALHLMARP
ncbi:polysaccharide export protein EpsE (plasmid) [Paracoccaceae bacterium]|nr:polysaccharide export protein EpsE [Paracoccaceae bacterium]